MEARTQLVPLQEMTAGSVAAIRNQVIKALVAQASKELGLPEERLVVRDIRPGSDLNIKAGSAAATANPAEEWDFPSTATSTGYEAICPTTNTMANERYVALFGIRDHRLGFGLHATATAVIPPVAGLGTVGMPSNVSLIKINVGGADKVIWDTKCMQVYRDNLCAFTSAAVIIPQNTAYQIYYYKTTTYSCPIFMQLIGIVVEPRGKLISP